MNFKFLFRFLWPSWKFFEDTGWHPELQIMLQEKQSWINVRFSDGRIYLWNWFFNPYLNLDLCAQSLVYQCLDLINQDKLLGSTEHILLKNLAKSGYAHIYKNLINTQPISYRILVTDALNKKTEVAFSEVITLSESTC